MPQNSLSTLALKLINVFEHKESFLNDERITVSDLLSKVASFYEKFRTAMDYGSEETIPRRAIERMLKRMLFLEGNSKNLAEDLVRELIWAGYFPNATVPHTLIKTISDSIDMHLELRKKISGRKILGNDEANEFIIHILSSEIFFILIPNKEKEAVANFMFRILAPSVVIEEESKQTKDIQVFLAVRKSFSRDDPAFLKYKLFTQIFGKLKNGNLESVASNFEIGFKEIKYQLSYPKKEKILSHIKKSTPPFLILYEILSREKGNIKNLIKDENIFKLRIFETCDRKYKSIKRKVRTAIFRSFIFILTTKAIIAFSIEGVFESIFLGKIQWGAIGINTILPPMIMAGAGLMIRTPNQQNSQAIYEDIQKLIFDENPLIAKTLVLKVKSKKSRSIKDYVFSIFWFFMIFFIFGALWFILGKLNFNILSKGIFLFFVAIISFLSYRIYQTAHSYTLIKKQNILSPLFDFFFVPILRVGRSLTEGFAQINFILLIIDFIIEAPFKGLIGFFEQWFLFVAAKREELE